MITTPLTAFNQGINDRSRYPLRNGVYKLKETLCILRRTKSYVEKVIRCKECKISLPAILGPCMGHEIAGWLKQIPIELSWLLGHNIVPAVSALSGDKVDPLIITCIQRNIEPEIERLLEDCAKTHTRISIDIGREYKNMQQGESEVLQLLMVAISICNRAIPLHEVSEK